MVSASLLANLQEQAPAPQNIGEFIYDRRFREII